MAYKKVIKHRYEGFKDYAPETFVWQISRLSGWSILYASASQVTETSGFIVALDAGKQLYYLKAKAWYEHNDRWQCEKTTIDELQKMLDDIVSKQEKCTVYWWRDKFQEFLNEQRKSMGDKQLGTGTEERAGVPQRTDEAVS